MSEERKEGVRRVWLSRNGSAWSVEPNQKERNFFGPFHTAYLLTPPEGAPEPGERRVVNGRVRVVLHVYTTSHGSWHVATWTENREMPFDYPLSNWLSFPLAPPKPKYRIPETELTEEQVEAVRMVRDHIFAHAPAVAKMLEVEEIPE